MIDNHGEKVMIGRVDLYVHTALHVRSFSPVIDSYWQAIHEKISSLDLKQVHAKIKQVDSHSTLGNGIVIQVSGWGDSVTILVVSASELV